MLLGVTLEVMRLHTYCPKKFASCELDASGVLVLAAITNTARRSGHDVSLSGSPVMIATTMIGLKESGSQVPSPVLVHLLGLEEISQFLILQGLKKH